MIFQRILAGVRSYLRRQEVPARYPLYDLVLASSRPDEIQVKEQYRYSFKLTGVQDRHLQEPAEGQIRVTVPYDGWYDINVITELEERLEQLIKLDWGKLNISDYGNSRLSEQLIPTLEDNYLLVADGVIPEELEPIQQFPKRRFKIHLAQNYQPNEPDHIPVEVQVKVLDEDEVMSKRELEKEARSRNDSQVTPEKLLIHSVTTHNSFQRSLSFCFHIIVTLPNNVVLCESDASAPVVVSYMSMGWPLATAPSHLRLRVHNLNGRVVRNTNEQVIFTPEGSSNGQGTLEWFNIPLILEQDDGNIYKSHEIWLDVDEPGEAQSERFLKGEIIIEFNGLLSGLQLQYEGREALSICEHSTIAVNYTIHLDECFANKRYSPQQHLQFPGVILNELRLADMLMLLKDKQFEVTEPFASEALPLGNDGGRRSIIEATRDEGAGKLILWLLIEGTPSQTVRERETKGKARYTTQLPTGQTVVYMHGGLDGDKKRAIQILNELHQQLKEYFRYVGTVD